LEFPDAPVCGAVTKIVLFGSVDELRGLLDSGFDPQHAHSGGHHRADDGDTHLEKAKLLLIVVQK